uniref:Uncharacterized protein n=1 Tax=Ditylenchus dipsaci TaxID=166011 RepID=A0A915DUN9_9BILA
MAIFRPKAYWTFKDGRLKVFCGVGCSSSSSWKLWDCQKKARINREKNSQCFYLWCKRSPPQGTPAAAAIC